LIKSGVNIETQFRIVTYGVKKLGYKKYQMSFSNGLYQYYTTVRRNTALNASDTSESIGVQSKT